MKIPFGYYGRIASRSGISIRHNISVNAGVIDSDYRGNIGICLVNHSNQDFNITAGDRCAQIIIEKYLANCVMNEVPSLDTTARNQNAYGSTGRSAIINFMNKFVLE